jgi:hypothetical protein
MHVDTPEPSPPLEEEDEEDAIEPDSPTAGNFENLLAGENRRESLGSVSSFGSSYGSSYSSIDRRPPSTCLSFRSNGPLRLETPPPCKRNSASHSSVGSRLSVTSAYDARIEQAKIVRYSSSSAHDARRDILSPAEQYL